MRAPQLLGGFAMLLTLHGCADATGNDADLRLGKFRLVRINGSPPPAFVTEGNSARIEFLGGAITLDKDGTFTDSTEVRITPKFGGPVQIQSDIASGNYRSANDTVFFTSTRGERYYMVYITELALQQELSGSLLLYNH